MSKQDLKTPVPDDVADLHAQFVTLHSEEYKSWLAGETLTLTTSDVAETIKAIRLSMQYGSKVSPIDIEKLIRAATTPSTPTVSEEDKARALEALDRLDCTLRGFYSECRSEMMGCDKEDIAAIKKLLLPTPRGEG